MSPIAQIADYPFTTLVPNLGVCTLDYSTTVFADIPGLLEGAHAGVGLGLEFLRHTERCRLLVHLLDGSGRDPLGDYAAIQQELRLFNPAVAEKPQVLALNKMDLPDVAERWPVLAAAFEAAHPGVRLLSISAATNAGVTELVREVHRQLASLPSSEEAAASAAAAEEASGRGGGGAAALGPEGFAGAVPGRLPFEDFELEGPVAVRGGGREWVVWGAALERLAQMTNWEYYESTTRFQRVLDLAGVTKALRRAGAREGDAVAVGNSMEFEWVDDDDKGRAYERWLKVWVCMGGGSCAHASFRSSVFCNLECLTVSGILYMTCEPVPFLSCRALAKLKEARAGRTEGRRAILTNEI